MPRDIKTIPTPVLKFEAKIYLAVGVASFALSTLVFLARNLLSEAFCLGVFFLGNMLGLLFLSIGFAFLVSAWLRPKGWVPEWTLKGADPQAQVQEWARNLEADHPGWVASESQWEPFSEPSSEVLWKGGWSGFLQRFFQRMEPLVWIHALRVRLVHRDGREVGLRLITGRSRDLSVPLVGGILMDVFVPQRLAGPVKFTWEDGWVFTEPADLPWLETHRTALGRLLDPLLNHRHENVVISEAMLMLMPRDAGVDVLVQTLPRETNGGFGRSLGVKEFLELVDLMDHRG